MANSSQMVNRASWLGGSDVKTYAYPPAFLSNLFSAPASCGGIHLANSCTSSDVLVAPASNGGSLLLFDLPLFIEGASLQRHTAKSG